MLGQYSSRHSITPQASRSPPWKEDEFANWGFPQPFDKSHEYYAVDGREPSKSYTTYELHKSSVKEAIHQKQAEASRLNLHKSRPQPSHTFQRMPIASTALPSSYRASPYQGFMCIEVLSKSRDDAVGALLAGVTGRSSAHMFQRPYSSLGRSGDCYDEEPLGICAKIVTTGRWPCLGLTAMM